MSSLRLLQVEFSDQAKQDVSSHMKIDLNQQETQMEDASAPNAEKNLPAVIDGCGLVGDHDLARELDFKPSEPAWDRRGKLVPR